MRTDDSRAHDFAVMTILLVAVTLIFLVSEVFADEPILDCPADHTDGTTHQAMAVTLAQAQCVHVVPPPPPPPPPPPGEFHTTLPIPGTTIDRICPIGCSNTNIWIRRGPDPVGWEGQHAPSGQPHLDLFTATKGFGNNEIREWAVSGGPEQQQFLNAIEGEQCDILYIEVCYTNSVGWADVNNNMPDLRAVVAFGQQATGLGAGRTFLSPVDVSPDSAPATCTYAGYEPGVAAIGQLVDEGLVQWGPHVQPPLNDSEIEAGCHQNQDGVDRHVRVFDQWAQEVLTVLFPG